MGWLSSCFFSSPTVWQQAHSSFSSFFHLIALGDSPWLAVTSRLPSGQEKFLPTLANGHLAITAFRPTIR